MNERQKGRKGAGAQSRVEQERKKAQQLDEKVDKAVASYIDNSDDWFELLPPSTRAQIISSRMPKVLPIDQDLEKSYISLTKSLEALPDIPELTERIRVISTELYHTYENLKLQRELYKKLRDDFVYKRDVDIQPIVDILGKVQKNAIASINDPRKVLLSKERIKEIIDEEMSDINGRKKQPRNTPDQGEVGAVPEEVEEVSVSVRD